MEVPRFSEELASQKGQPHDNAISKKISQLRSQVVLCTAMSAAMAIEENWIMSVDTSAEKEVIADMQFNSSVAS